MSRTMLVILLGLSLIFNAFFLLGRFGPGTIATADPAERIAKTLDLTDRQRVQFTQLRTQLNSDTAAPRARIAQLQGDLAAELESDNPDVDRVRALVDQIGNERLAARSLAADHLGSFIDMLDPQQRRLLGRRMGELSRLHKRPPPDLSEFDIDGDGTLDETEHAQATSAIRQRHDEMRERRQAMTEEFDLDGDGTLNPQERQAFREALLERGLIPPRRRGDFDGQGERRGNGRRGHPQGHPQGPPPEGSPAGPPEHPRGQPPHGDGPPPPA